MNDLEIKNLLEAALRSLDDLRRDFERALAEKDDSLATRLLDEIVQTADRIDELAARLKSQS